MPAERWILVGIRDRAQETTLRKELTKLGFRTTCIKNAKECAELCQRRVFLAGFFDRHTLRDFVRKCSFPSPMYLTLLVEWKEIPKANTLQADEKIHEWLTIPVEKQSLAAILVRARTHLRQAVELEAIRTTAAETIRNDAALICTGKWKKTIDAWIEKVRKGDSPILLAGEAGTGKRLIARFLHCRSPRASSPFVIVSCHNQSAPDLERDIFGEIPPRNRPPASVPLRSKFSLAANGTVMFDKVEQMPRRTQQRLARAIQTGRFSPTGGGDMLTLGARLIFTIQTPFSGSLSKILQKDLSRLLKRSVFHIPPLRERKEDFPAIARTLLERIRREFGARPEGLTDRAMDLLKNHSWPGNIREMEGVLWAASVMAGRANISPRVLTPLLSNGGATVKEEERALEEIVEERLTTLFGRFGVNDLQNLHPMVMERVEKPLFKLVLQQTHGNQVRASQLLGINRNTLRRKLTQYGIR